MWLDISAALRAKAQKDKVSYGPIRRPEPSLLIALTDLSNLQYPANLAKVIYGRVPNQKDHGKVR